MLNIRVEGAREIQFDIDRILSQAPVSIEKLVRGSALIIADLVKANLSNKILNVNTGHLRRSITMQFSGSGRGSSAEIGTNLKYAAIHEFGGTIHAKRGPYLWFKMQTASRIRSSSGKSLKRPQGIFSWVRTPQVTIPARPYMQPAFEQSLPLIDKLIETEIMRLVD